MAAALEIESTLTDKYQTTVPETVRRALKLGKRDKIHYAITPGGDVVMTRAEQIEKDPVVEQFLSFFAAEMQSHPERIQAVGADLVQHIHSLIGAVEVDLNSPLTDDNE